MKRTKLVQKMALLVGTACLALTTFICPAATISTQAASATESTIQPRQDRIEYVYKIENGKLYKRLYNYSTDNWIGDWIYVCDYPG